MSVRKSKKNAERSQAISKLRKVAELIDVND